MQCGASEPGIDLLLMRRGWSTTPIIRTAHMLLFKVIPCRAVPI